MRDPSRARWPIIVSPVAWPDLTYHIPSNTARTESCYSLRPLSFPPHGRTVAFVLILSPHPPNAHIMKWEHSASNETSERDPFITQRINGLNKKYTSHCLHISQMCDSLSLIHEQNKKEFSETKISELLRNIRKWHMFLMNTRLVKYWCFAL